MSGRPRVCVVSQPTYLPWLGYFDLLSRADVFVFLDDVQFERRSWQSRNRILAASGEVMLSVPVRRHDRVDPISAIATADDQPWRDKHLAAVRHAYARAPGIEAALAWFEPALRGHPPGGALADLTCGLIETAAARLGFSPAFVRASALGCGGRRSEHLLAICRAVGAEVYLSTTGAADYLAEDGVFERAGFPVRLHRHEPRPYPQRAPGFTPYMGVLDAVASVGWDGTRALITGEPS